MILQTKKQQNRGKGRAESLGKLTAAPKNHHQRDLSLPYFKFVSAATAAVDPPVMEGWRLSIASGRVRRVANQARSKQGDNVDATHLQVYVGKSQVCFKTARAVASVKLGANDVHPRLLVLHPVQ